MKKFTILLGLMLIASISIAQFAKNIPSSKQGKSMPAFNQTKNIPDFNQIKNKAVLQQKAYDFTELTFPVEDMSVAFNESTPEIITAGLYGYFFSFTITDSTDVLFKTDNSIPHFALSTDDSLDNIINNGPAMYGVLDSGTYYFALYVYDSTLLKPGFTSLFSIFTPVIYTELDYSDQIVLNESKCNEAAGMQADISLGNGPVANYAQGYSFNVAKGTYYKVNIEAFSDNPEIFTGLIIMNDSLTGEIGNDQVFQAVIFPGQSHCENIYYADSTQTLKLIFVGVNFMDYSSFDLFYTIKIEENENSYNDLPTTEEFSWEPMTLPFSSILHFEPGYNVMIDTMYYGVDAAILFSKGFILNVPADSVIRLNYVSGYNEQLNWRPPLYIYTDESLSNQISSTLWEYNYFTLSEGTYYLVFTDDEFTYQNPGLGYYNCFVYLTKDVFPSVSDTITLQELLDNSNITEVDYSNDLPFSDQDFWQVNSSAIVMGQNNPDFGYENRIYFAKAYKLTNMQVGDSVNIHAGGEYGIDSYLYIYKKNGTNYEKVAFNDDYYEIEPAFLNGYGDSYLKFFAPEACDYYIVATTYSSYYPEMNGKAMSTTMWAGEVNNEPEINMGTLLSTTASETTISFTLEESEVSDLDRKNALLPLNITGTLSDHSTVVMNNTPFTWTINTSKAVFTGVDFYVLDANYTPAEVEFTYSSIVVEGTAKSAISLYPNPASNYINIDGLEGKEQIFIIDNSGRIVKSVSTNEAMQTINIDDLAQGIYLVTIRKENKIEVLKFIK